MQILEATAVCTQNRVEPGMRIMTRDNDSVTLRLTGLFYPASITLMQETVNNGDTVTFYCKMPPDIEVHKTWNFYLCKNRESIMLQKWSRAESGVTFVIRKVTNADTGSYSCVYSEQKVEPGMRIKTRDNDSVTLRLTASLFVEYAVRHFLSAVIALLILGLLFKVYRARMHEPVYKLSAEPGDVKNISHGSSVYPNVQDEKDEMFQAGEGHYGPQSPDGPDPGALGQTDACGHSRSPSSVAAPIAIPPHPGEFRVDGKRCPS
ncbi:UNVERIFIED_CONTAM: hypothetical protein FKN15_052751 [Acipenser sinensis]